MLGFTGKPPREAAALCARACGDLGALEDRLLDSFNILQDYGKAASWARREADFASSLLAFIPRACTVSGERKS